MRKSLLLLIVMALVVVPLLSQAHILKLKDGRILKGKFISGMTDVLRFHVEGDTIHEFTLDEILSIHFSSASIHATPPPAAEPVKIFPGTTIRVTLTSELNTMSSNAGDRFFGELAEDFVVGDVTLSPGGKRVFGRVRKVVKPKRENSRANIEILITDLTIAGKQQPVTTDYFGVENDGKGNYTLLGTAKPVDANIPHFIDDRNLRIPAGTVIEFRITQPLTIRGVQ
jgi:hypothetical protein